MPTFSRFSVRFVASFFVGVICLPGMAFGAPSPTFLTNVTCSFLDITNGTVSACSGFWDGNLLNTGAPGPADADEKAGLTAMGLGAGPFPVIQKIADTNNQPADFTSLLYGTTVIGIHFGGGADRFKNAVPDYDGNGGGTAFYVFDAGTTGLDTIIFAADLASASSGATLYSTGVALIPEPETYAMLLAGLGLIGFIVRRRQRAV